MVEVDDLTGVNGAGQPLIPDADAQDGDQHARRRRVLRWVGGGVLAALATGVLVVNVQVAREVAVRQAALAGLPWVLPRMNGPLEEVWRAPGGWVVAETSEVLVTSPNTGEGGLFGVDARTGEIVWEQPGAQQGNCSGVIDYSGWEADPVGFVLPEPDLLMCLPMDAYGQDTRPTPDLAVEIAFEIVFLDVATGVQVSSVTLDGAVLFSESVDGDVALSFVRSDAGITVLRLDPHTGGVLWTYRSDPGVLPEGAFGSWSYGLDDGVLRLGAGELDLAIALDDGTEVASSPSDTADPPMTVARLADGSTVEWVYQPTGLDGTVRVLEPDGAVRFEVSGVPWWFGATDGSAADVVLVRQQGSAGADSQGSQVIALDAATGETLWSLPDLGDMSIALIDGVALTSGATVGAIDVRSGRRLWEFPVENSVYVGALTDGELQLVPVGAAGTLQLAAVSVRTGTEAWRIPLPDGTTQVSSTLGGLVLVTTGTELIAYR